jgi:hypothetical protein
MSSFDFPDGAGSACVARQLLLLGSATVLVAVNESNSHGPVRRLRGKHSVWDARRSPPPQPKPAGRNRKKESVFIPDDQNPYVNDAVEVRCTLRLSVSSSDLRCVCVCVCVPVRCCT